MPVAEPRAARPSAEVGATAEDGGGGARSAEEVLAAARAAVRSLQDTKRSVERATDVAQRAMEASKSFDRQYEAFDKKMDDVMDRFAERLAPGVRRAPAARRAPGGGSRGAGAVCPRADGAGARKSWQPPHGATERGKALATSRDAAFDPSDAPWLKTCLLQCCTPLTVQDGSDWLAKGQPGAENGDRRGETFAQFCRPGPRRAFPSKYNGKIYLTPIGPMDDAPDTSVLLECLRVHFQMEVVLAAPILGEDFEKIERSAGHRGLGLGWGYGPQLETPSCAELLERRKPRDAFVNIGFTMSDICHSAKGFGFLFGQAQLDKGVGIFSFARYASESPALFARRCCMVLVHETMHLFGIKHCVHAECLMNGSNSLEESDRRPFAACPVCLAKFRDGMRGVWPNQKPGKTKRAAPKAGAGAGAGAGGRAKAKGKAKGGGAVAEEPLLRREREVLRFLEAQGMEKDAQLCRERLAVMTA